MQQQDNESKSAFLMRRAGGLNSLDFLEKTLKQGQSLLLGLKVSPDTKQLQAELVLQARDKSDLGAEFRGLGRQPSFFHGMMTDDGIVNIASTWKINPQEKERHGDIYQALQEVLKETRTRVPPRAPFQLSARIDQFIEMGDRSPEWLKTMAKEYLQPEHDVLRFQIKPSNAFFCSSMN